MDRPAGVDPSRNPRFRSGNRFSSRAPCQAGRSRARRFGGARELGRSTASRTPGSAARWQSRCRRPKSQTFQEAGTPPARGKGTFEAIDQDLRSNLLPGVIIVPAMVIAIEQAQKAGIAYNKQ